MGSHLAAGCVLSRSEVRRHFGLELPVGLCLACESVQVLQQIMWDGVVTFRWSCLMCGAKGCSVYCVSVLDPFGEEVSE